MFIFLYGFLFIVAFLSILAIIGYTAPDHKVDEDNTGDDKDSDNSVRRENSDEDPTYTQFEYEDYYFKSSNITGESCLRSTFYIDDDLPSCENDFIDIFDYIFVQDYRLEEESKIQKAISLEESNQITENIKRSEVNINDEVVLNITQLWEAQFCSYDIVDEDLKLRTTSIKDNPDLICSTERDFPSLLNERHLSDNYDNANIRWKQGKDGYYNTADIYYKETERVKELVSRMRKEEIHGGDNPRIFKNDEKDEMIDVGSEKTNRFINFNENRVQCAEELKDLNQELKAGREFDSGNALLLDEYFKIPFDKETSKYPSVTLDLHGFRKYGGRYATEEFLGIMYKHGVDRFKIVYGRSGNTMRKIAKNCIEQFSRYNSNIECVNFKDTAVFVTCDTKEDWVTMPEIDFHREYVELYPNWNLKAISFRVYNGQGLFNDTHQFVDGERFSSPPTLDTTNSLRFEKR